MITPPCAFEYRKLSVFISIGDQVTSDFLRLHSLRQIESTHVHRTEPYKIEIGVEKLINQIKQPFYLSLSLHISLTDRYIFEDYQTYWFFKVLGNDVKNSMRGTRKSLVCSALKILQLYNFLTRENSSSAKFPQTERFFITLWEMRCEWNRRYALDHRMLVNIVERIWPNNRTA